MCNDKPTLTSALAFLAQRHLLQHEIISGFKDIDIKVIRDSRVLGRHHLRAVKPCDERKLQKAGCRTALVSFSKPTVAPTVTRQFFSKAISDEYFWIFYRS